MNKYLSISLMVFVLFCGCIGKISTPIPGSGDKNVAGQAVDLSKQAAKEKTAKVVGESSTGVNSDSSKMPEQSSELGPVNVTAHLDHGDESITLIVQFDIETDWFMYAEEGFAAAPASIRLELPTGISAAEEWQRPLPTFNLLSPDEKIYKNRVEYKKNLVVEEGVFDEMKVHISYQLANGTETSEPKFVTRTIRVEKRD